MTTSSDLAWLARHAAKTASFSREGPKGKGKEEAFLATNDDGAARPDKKGAWAWLGRKVCLRIVCKERERKRPIGSSKEDDSPLSVNH